MVDTAPMYRHAQSQKHLPGNGQIRPKPVHMEQRRRISHWFNIRIIIGVQDQVHVLLGIIENQLTKHILE